MGPLKLNLKSLTQKLQAIGLVSIFALV